MTRRSFEALLLSLATLVASFSCSRADQSASTSGTSSSTGGSDSGCAADELACADQCVDAQSDPGNCGACGLVCPAGTSCSKGDCVCQAGLDDCDGTCTDLSRNNLDCGACGNACAIGQACTDSECLCAHGSACSDSCVDLETSSQNCGSCGTECDPSQRCSAGSCECHTELTACGSECVAIVSDPNHCGDCGTECAEDEVCSQGRCAASCADGETDCGGACIADLATDRQNCGKCGVACDSDRVCSGGKCSCADGLTDCDGGCVDTELDAENCGACGHSCVLGQGCSDGECSCPSGQLTCDETCVDVMTDPNHCGRCNTVCSGAQGCTNGVCVCPRGEVCEGSGGSGGSGGGGGTSGTGGGGSGGTPSTGGSGGSGGTGRADCTISADLAISDNITTVGVVTFTTTLKDLTSASIQFEPAAGGARLMAPVNLEAPDYRTLLLGMKSETEYAVQVSVSSDSTTCDSAIYSLTTGTIPAGVPTVTLDRKSDDVTPGFIVTSRGISGMGVANARAFIFDQDGDVVWYANAPPQPSRARMSYDGESMWVMSLNVGGNAGRVDRISMDGAEREDNVSGLEDAHHDLTVLPDGSVAAIVHQNDCSAIIERAEDGTITQVVEDVETLYEPVGECHPNAIQYYPGDDTYTVSDRNPNLFVKFTRQGELRWQFGGENPHGAHFPGTWTVNHGHHMLPNGHFLFFNNTNGSSAIALEFELDEASWTATEVWSYESEYGSPTLGDVQRLPNGHTIVTYSNNGVIHEVGTGGKLVQSFTSSVGSFGYANFRPTLYGPPPR